MSKTLILALVLGCAGLSCGDDDDAPGGDGPAADGPAADGPGADSTSDGGAADGPASDGTAGGGLGDLCATMAAPGTPGSCADPYVCCAGDTTLCVEAEDCGGGGGFVACDDGGDCFGGRVCCDVSGVMRFCGKQTTCDELGGTVIP